jgi:hypothetical protein
MTKPPWRPRASSLGVYSSCLWRAVQDRLVYEGQQAEPPKQDDTSAASLGTCIHFTLQDGIRCNFPAKRLVEDVGSFALKINKLEDEGQPLDATTLTPGEVTLLEATDEHFDRDLSAADQAFRVGDPRCFQPTKIEWEDAAKLWSGNIDICREQVRTAASLGAARVPPLPAGQRWSAEDELENEYTTGHTDFLSPDRKVLGDLKTTAKPPQGGWIKPAHLMQMTAYHLLTGAERCWVLYLDSMKGRWVNIVWIDFLTDGMKFYAEQVEAFCRFLMSDKLFDVAYPNLGDHCVYSWCRYKSTCYSTIMPRPGSLYNLSIARKAVGPIRLSPV